MLKVSKCPCVPLFHCGSLLQDVLRRWHSRQKEVIHTVVNLARNAEIAAEGFETGLISQLNR